MITDALLTELEVLSSDFIRKYDELGMRATGEWAESIEIQMREYGGDILGKDYTQYLTNGRASGGMPPISNLEKWVAAKFGYTDQKQIKSTAFAIAKKIQKEGTEYHKQGGTDLIDGVLTQEREQEITDSVGNVVLTNISEQIQRAIFA